MATIDTLNAKEILDSIRQECEAELRKPGVLRVIRQEWLVFESAMVYIHVVHCRLFTVLTIGIPLPETPPVVHDSFSDAQNTLEEFYGLIRSS